MKPDEIKELMIEKEMEHLSEIITKSIYTESENGIVIYVGKDKTHLRELADRCSKGYARYLFKDFQMRIYYKEELKVVLTIPENLIKDFEILKSYKINYITANFNDNFKVYSPRDLPLMNNLLLKFSDMFISDELFKAAHLYNFDVIINFRRVVCEFSIKKDAEMFKSIEFKNQKICKGVILNELTVPFQGALLFEVFN